jgi:hypothetical protein
MISAIAKVITDDPPADELDDDPIKTTAVIIPPQLKPYSYKYRITLPNNSPESYGLFLLASRQEYFYPAGSIAHTLPETSISHTFKS